MSWIYLYENRDGVRQALLKGYVDEVVTLRATAFDEPAAGSSTMSATRMPLPSWSSPRTGCEAFFRLAGVSIRRSGGEVKSTSAQAMSLGFCLGLLRGRCRWGRSLVELLSMPSSRDLLNAARLRWRERRAGSRGNQLQDWIIPGRAAPLHAGALTRLFALRRVSPLTL
jgi:hypothetical protein